VRLQFPPCPATNCAKAASAPACATASMSTGRSPSVVTTRPAALSRQLHGGSRTTEPPPAMIVGFRRRCPRAIWYVAQRLHFQRP
jgi:hypothetical protein